MSDYDMVKPEEVELLANCQLSSLPSALSPQKFANCQLPTADYLIFAQHSALSTFFANCQLPTILSSLSTQHSALSTQHFLSALSTIFLPWYD